jgi:hypothetical protein
MNADDLFTLSRLLGHAPDELDFLLLLRAIDDSENPLRREHLEARRDEIRRSRDLAGTPQPLDAARLVHTEEMDKRSFLATFAADEDTFLKLPERFRKFLSKEEQLVAASRPKATYQMAFDLFLWV